jgi:uncharacterized protein
MSEASIHAYKLGGYNIILDVNSSSVHISDELTYDLLAKIKPPFLQALGEDVINRFTRFYTEEEVLSCYEEIKELYKDDLLYAEDEYSELAHTAVPSPIKALCLLVAEDCNLQCRYCFAAGGDYGKGKSIMPLETAKAAIDFLISHSADRENLEVDFFGGEPLLNWDVVTETVKYGRSLEKKYGKRFRFTVTTNGILLDDEKIDFINAEMSNVVLSLDGRKDVHDAMRNDSYDACSENFKKLVSKREGKDYYIRGTFTRHNLDFSEDVIAIYNEGFDQISVEPVIADPSCDYAITERDLPAIFSEYEKLARILINKRQAGEHINFFHFMIDLDQGPCAIKRMRGCGCGNEYVAVAPSGDIYPCHQFSGLEEYKLGNIFLKNFNFELKNTFACSTVYSKPECSECWAKYYCSGGCDANNARYSGDIKTPVKLYCELQKKRLECAIAIKAGEAMPS